MNSCTCINSASFSWFVLFSMLSKRSLVVKLFKFAGKYLNRASTNIGQKKLQELSKPPNWHVGSGTMFFSCTGGRLVSCISSLIRVWRI